ncbi:GDSL-type esterase/lipase family protein [Serinibacter arcticus]|uniref:GDSL-type esterase/lipase family protein n=1 Tax=Serinibacter arcticus TaxID=1655435 RepID=UPI001092F623|nr:GDSL-type esterase/lipase family protein [Serinibacter arcticus]
MSTHARRARRTLRRSAFLVLAAVVGSGTVSAPASAASAPSLESRADTLRVLAADWEIPWDPALHVWRTLARAAALQTREPGTVRWSRAGSGLVVRAELWPAYRDHGAEAGPLGPPTRNESATTGGWVQPFEGGRLYRSRSQHTVAATTPGAIVDRWDALGGPDSSLGLPVVDKTAVGGGYAQEFTGGVLVWGPRTGAVTVDHPTYRAWQQDPTALGWPVRDVAPDGSGTTTVFEKGTTQTRDGVVHSGETVDASAAVVLCDSQCGGDGWTERGAREVGFGTVVERAYGGIGYVATGPWGFSMTEAVESGRVLLPAGDPGVVIVTLGGNDSAVGTGDAEIVEGVRRLTAAVRLRYPTSPIVVDGVMSRTGADHERRREVDALITAEALRMGLATVSVAGWGDGVEYTDGVHLTPAGQAAAGRRYGPALRAALGL